MYSDTQQEQQDWMNKLTMTVDRVKGVGGTGNVNRQQGSLSGGTGQLSGSGGQGGQGMSGGQPIGSGQGGQGMSGQPVGSGQGGQGMSGGQPIGNGQPGNQGMSGQTQTGQTQTGGQGMSGQTQTGGQGLGGQMGGPKPTGQIGGNTGQVTGGAILSRAKENIPFMIDESNKVLEFWNIWFESIPKQNEIPNNSLPNYQLILSCDGNELSWRASGSQNVFIQKMVDFFWNVGAPESEIDRLNDFGALVNPVSIGSWINMSKIGGMDGGWFFPVPLSLKIALEACDPDSNERDGNVSAGSDETPKAVKTFIQWTESNKIDECIYVGRDMGAAPPRQTELRVRLTQQSVAEQLNIALSAVKAFRFPDIPNNILQILRQFTNPGLVLSVITSSEGFVKIGILFPNPNWNLAMQLIEEGRKFSDTSPAPIDIFGKLNNIFRNSGPEFIEFQYLNPGFGYNVYKEEFNVFVHYTGQ